MKSKFTIRSFLIPLLAIAFFAICYSITSANWPIRFSNLRWIDYYMGILFLFTIVWLVFGEIRTKMIIVEIEDFSISKRNFFGLRKSFSFKDFDGFQTCLITSKGDTNEYLYLMKNGEKQIVLSEVYHRNYFELKMEVGKRCAFLGEVKFSYWESFKEIFKS